MKRIVTRIRTWFTGWLPLSRRNKRLARKYVDLDARVAAIVKDGEKRHDTIQRAADKLERQYEITRKELDTTRLTIERYESDLTAVREELRLANDITIPALVSAHKLLLERWDAETAIQVRKQVAAGANER